MTVTARWLLAAAALAMLAGACGRPRVSPTPPRSSDACVAWPATARRADSASVVVTWAVNPANLPWPTNPGERFAFAHGYEPLVLIDCLGRLTPALARSWTLANGGSRLRIVLSDSARFWNGDPVRARDVIASWAEAGREPAAELPRRLAESATVIDASTFEVGCTIGLQGDETGSGDCATLAVLGHPELAVSRHVSGARWPEGTGTHRIREAAPVRPSAGAFPRSTLFLDPTAAVGTHLTVHSVGVADARDLIDARVDLMLTEDPALAAYAAARSELIPLPLGWDRTWALLTPARHDLDIDSIAARTVVFRTMLARDVVPAEAHAAEVPDWWREAIRCAAPNTPPQREPPARVNSRVVARSDEPVARALTERLVALAAVRPSAGSDSSLALLTPALHAAGARATAAALSPNEFAAAVRAGRELAFVVALPRRSLSPCADAGRLRGMAPWLAGDRSPLSPASMAPLVNTRLQAVVRRDWLALTMTWDSTVVVSQP